MECVEYNTNIVRDVMNKCGIEDFKVLFTLLSNQLKVYHLFAIDQPNKFWDNNKQ